MRKYSDGKFRVMPLRFADDKEAKPIELEVDDAQALVSYWYARNG